MATIGLKQFASEATSKATIINKVVTTLSVQLEKATCALLNRDSVTALVELEYATTEFDALWKDYPQLRRLFYSEPLEGYLRETLKTAGALPLDKQQLKAISDALCNAKAMATTTTSSEQ